MHTLFAGMCVKARACVLGVCSAPEGICVRLSSWWPWAYLGLHTRSGHTWWCLVTHVRLRALQGSPAARGPRTWTRLPDALSVPELQLPLLDTIQ